MSSSLLSASYAEVVSEGEVIDSRFNDISCISYGERTADEKETVSRLDVSKELMNLSHSSANHNSTDTKHSQEQPSFSVGAKRKFCDAFARNDSFLSEERFDRSLGGRTTAGVKRCNPMPRPIPIPCEMALPPDRPKFSSGSSPPKENISSVSSWAPAERGLQPPLSVTQSDGLESLLLLGRSCAKLLNAVCVSTQLSKSYKQESLRFTCQNGHNFFLAVDDLKTTFSTLLKVQGRESLDDLVWCAKCAKFYAKVKVLANRLGLDIGRGLYERKI